MGKAVFVEGNILSYLKNLSTSNACSTGLILGQSTDSKDYVALLVRTPEQWDKEVASALPAIFKSVKEIKESWVADHAKHVTKMLPGGLFVLGVFICSSTDIFSDNSLEKKAKTILNFLKKQLSNEPLLHGNSPCEKLLLHFNTSDSKCICRSLDVNNIGSSFQSAELKFQDNCTKWCQISCNFDLSQPSFGGNMSYPLKDQLKNALSEVNKNLSKAMIILNDQLQSPNESLEAVIKKGNLKNLHNSNDLPSLKANIFIPFSEKPVNEHEIVVKECDVELHLLGVLASQIFISQNSTVAEAISAVKQDVVRSLAARFEMHWDSLVEEEYGSPEEKLSVHEPPRRVSVLLKDSKIAFNDYLFPGEGAPEVITNFKDMLDMAITENNVGKEIEMQGDPMEFYGKSCISLSPTTSDEILGSPLPKWLILLVVSTIIILIGIAIALFSQKLENKSHSTI